MSLSGWASPRATEPNSEAWAAPCARKSASIFATLAEVERDLIRERTTAGLAAARARGGKGGRKFALTKAPVRLAQAAVAQRDTSVSDLCRELGIERVTLSRHVSPKGELRDYGRRVLG
jgi:DNA invertase Pin-like site-specific DNA recombinase